MALSPGTPAPWFEARTHLRPDFAFSSLGGYFILLAVLPTAGPARDAATAVLEAHRGLFDGDPRVAFAVTRDEAHFAAQRETNGFHVFHDPEGAIARLYRCADESGEVAGQWIIIDPGLRVLFTAPIEDHARAFRMIAACADPDDHAGVPLHAPVLIMPRVFEPELCRRLIDLHRAQGGRLSGVMREVDGVTVAVLDSLKSRRDVDIEDKALQTELMTRMGARLLPEIQKAFQFKVTRLERHLVARYDAEEGGFFRRHRDNTTRGTAHRRFACSINLNAEEFEGGDLRFPEFGAKTYRPPTGGAVVFSCSLLHEATPVTRGERFAYLPFFYDEEGARIREANLQYFQAPAAREAAQASTGGSQA